MNKMYYVTAKDGDACVPASGPYGTHKEALDNVKRVIELASNADPKCWFYEWGTAKMKWNGPGVVDCWERDGLCSRADKL